MDFKEEIIGRLITIETMIKNAKDSIIIRIKTVKQLNVN